MHAESMTVNGPLHNRQFFKKIEKVHYHRIKQQLEVSEIAKFGCERL